MSFCSKICLIFESHFEAIHFTELFKSAYSCAHSYHERMYVVMTNESASRWVNFFSSTSYFLQ